MVILNILIILTRFNANPFIYDPNSTNKFRSYLMPIGLAYITSILKKDGFNVDVLNLNHKHGLIKDILKEELTKKHYDVVFTGGVSIYYPNIRDYINYIREISPKTKIIIGGGLISSQPEIMFKLLKPDFIVVGEGEITAIELVRCVQNNGDISTVDGIGYPDNNGNLILNKPRKPIMDLDNLPYPDYEAFEFEEFLTHTKPTYISYDYFDEPRVYPILASRSCPFACTFCFHTIGNKYRQRSIDNIIDEMKYAINKYHVNVFFFYDELFAYDKERAMEFCTKLKQYLDTVPYEIRINLNLRVDCADEEIIKAMKSVNCNPVGLGLESYSQTILKSMKKHTTPDQIKNALKLISDNGLTAQGSFILGDSAETFDTMNETLNFYDNNQDILGAGVSLGFIIPFQGSPIYKHCVKKGIIKDEIEFIENRAKNGYNFYHPINLTDTMSDRDFERMRARVFQSVSTTGYHVTPFFNEKVNDISEIHVKCPHCNKISKFKNLNPIGILDTPNVGCKHCNKRFYIVTKYYPFIKY